MATFANRPLLQTATLVLLGHLSLVACQGAAPEVRLDLEIKAPHFVDSSPAHAEIFAARPINVVVNTNFDLMTGSSLKVLLNGEDDYGEGETTLDENRLTMRRAIRKDAPEGTYLVLYRACWPDGSCHDGQFSFEIDRDRIGDYEDLRGRAEVVVSMDTIQFLPIRIIVSPGTRIIWRNEENIEHFVNTDPHPSHTYYLAQNSLGIAEGETFALTFEEPGEYPYHCSAHYPAGMIGRIIVAAKEADRSM